MTTHVTMLYAGEAVPNDIVLNECVLPVSEPPPEANNNVKMWTTADESMGGGEGVFPNPDDVRAGMDYGPTGTEYDGDLILPAPSNVKEGVGYGADGNEYVGTFVASLIKFIMLIPYIFKGKPRF